jgi:hypothetical protein
MTRLSCCLFPAFLAVLPQGAQAWTAAMVLDEARTLCAGFEGGEISVQGQAVHAVELTGAAPAEQVIDWSAIGCSTMASAWGGTGGSTLSILIEGQRFDHMALDWRVIDYDGPVLMLRQHGSNCNGAGTDRCVQALLWTAGTLTGAGWPVAEDEGAAAQEGD